MVIVSEAKCIRQPKRKLARQAYNFILQIVTTEHLLGRYWLYYYNGKFNHSNVVVVTSQVVRVYLGSIEANSIKQSERKLAQTYSLVPRSTADHSDLS